MSAVDPRERAAYLAKGVVTELAAELVAMARDTDADMFFSVLMAGFAGVTAFELGKPGIERVLAECTEMVAWNLGKIPNGRAH